MIHVDLANSNTSLFAQLSNLWCCTNIPSFVTKGSASWKIFWQTLIEILNLCYDLDHKHNPVFSLDTYDTGHSSLWWSVIKLSLVAKELLVPRSVGSKWILTSCQSHKVDQDNQTLSKTNASFKLFWYSGLSQIYGINPYTSIKTRHTYKHQKYIFDELAPSILLTKYRWTVIVWLNKPLWLWR